MWFLFTSSLALNECDELRQKNETLNYDLEIFKSGNRTIMASNGIAAVAAAAVATPTVMDTDTMNDTVMTGKYVNFVL